MCELLWFPLQVMLLTLLAVSCSLSHSHASRFNTEFENTLEIPTSGEVCNGGTLTLPHKLTAYLNLYELDFRPRSGGSRYTIVRKGEVVVKDPRYKYAKRVLTLRDVMKKDEGTYYVTLFFYTVRVRDCPKRTETLYMRPFKRSPLNFEYVEYNPDSDTGNMKVLWNHSDPEAGRGRIRLHQNIWEMEAVTPLDNGFYNFKQKDDSMVNQLQLFVTGHNMDCIGFRGHNCVIKYPVSNLADAFWKVTFNRKKLIMKEGKWIIDEQSSLPKSDFTGRVQVAHSSLTIYPLKYEDEGIFTFTDKGGNLILTVKVSVRKAPPVPYSRHRPFESYYVRNFVPLIIPVMLFCTCLVHCCHNAPNRPGDAAQGAAASDVHNEDTTQPSAPTAPAHSYPALPAGAPSHQPAVSRGEVPSLRPPAYDSLGILVSETPAASQDNIPSAPSYQPASAEELPSEVPPSYNMVVHGETEVRFEIEGATFPSAPPLDSGSTASAVYNSDKLNFL